MIPFFPRRLLAAAIGCALAACSSTPPPLPSRYQPATWQDLPGWPSSLEVASFNAWRSGCSKLQRQPVWQAPCHAAQQVSADPATIRAFMETQLQPLQLINPDGSADGLITGYYEPVYRGSPTRTAAARYPLHGRPDDLIQVELGSLYPELKGKRLRGRVVGQKLVPYPSHAEISQAGIKAPVLAWLEDPLDVQFMQIQGSGRVLLPNGEELRLGYADQNGHPYQPIGRWLVQQGELPASEVSMQSIRRWASENPHRLEPLLHSNPSYVFFRRLPAGQEGPLGSLGIPLHAQRSIAVDPASIPLGSPVYLATSRPDNQQPLQGLVAAQDTGGAIRGQVRADFFWGTGPQAGELAGIMKQRGQLWLLWPKDAPLPR